MFNLVNLEEVRNYMLEEIESDIESGKLYISSRLNTKGKHKYPIALKKAAKDGNIESFSNNFGMNNFNSHETRDKDGKVIRVKVPQSANITLCEDEFNRYYIRAVCLKALEREDNFVIVYRARLSINSRPESIAIDNTQIDAKKLLNDLRTKIGVDTALGLPPGPNSGMSIKLIGS